MLFGAVSLTSRSIESRLSLQARAAIVMSFAVVGTILAGSLLSVERQERATVLADQAVHSAILEKDFASLERDVFRHAALNTAQSREGVETNFGDMEKSIAEARAALDAEEQELIDKVAQSNAAYVAAVRVAMAGAVVDPVALAAAEKRGEETDKAIEAIRDPVIAKAEANASDLVRLSWLTLVGTAAISLLAGAYSFILARRIRSSISGELGEISDTIGRIGAGELATPVPFEERDDDVGRLARAAVNLRESNRARVAGEAEMRQLVEVMGDVLAQLSKGDLTIAMPDVGVRFGQLRADFNNAVRALHDAFGSVANSAGVIENGAIEIDAASADLAQRTEAHAASIGAAALSLSDVSSTVSDTADGAGRAAVLVNAAVQEVEAGGTTIRSAVSAMSNIEKASGEISQIISVIDGITFQTNLLALNAGVEAARAGDAGKGFAVVASEVRALAQRSSDAARQIRDLIETSGREVSGGVELVRQAGKAFDSLGMRIGEITALVDRIRDASTLQSDSLTAVSTSVSGMDRVTQQNAAMVEETTAAARSLSMEARQMTALVGTFRVANRHIALPRIPVSRPEASNRPAPAVSGNLALAHDDDFTDF